MGIPIIGLEYLSTFGLRPRDYVHLAASSGYEAVGINLSGAANALGGAPRYDFRDDPELRQELAKALRETQLSVSLVEGFAIVPQGDVADFEGYLDWVASLGARAICAVSLERDRERSCDQFALLTSLASACGILTTTEVGAGILKNLDRAIAMASAVADTNFRLLIDTMHFFRSGSTVADFAELDANMIGHVQLCDVPMPARSPNYMDEALHERQIVGEGDLPLADLVPLIPEDVPVGLEIPVRSNLVDGKPSEEFLSKALASARALWLPS